jgi:hypothetical protein
MTTIKRAIKMNAIGTMRSYKNDFSGMRRTPRDGVGFVGGLLGMKGRLLLKRL